MGSTFARGIRPAAQDGLERDGMNRTVLLTHDDLDGLVSGILLLTRTGTRAGVLLTRGYLLAETLGKVNGSGEPIDALFITDLPLIGSTSDAVYAELRTAHDRGAALHLYDHHPGWEEPAALERLKPLFSEYRLRARGSTAAAVVWTDYLRRDPSQERWLELLSAKDKSTDQRIRDDFHLLCAPQRSRGSA